MKRGVRVLPTLRRMRRRLAPAPMPGRCSKRRLVLRPVVERGWVEIRAGRPDNRVNFRVKGNPGEQIGIAQRSAQLARQQRLEINGAGRAVVETQAQRIRADALHGLNPANAMTYRVILLNG